MFKVSWQLSPEVSIRGDLYTGAGGNPGACGEALGFLCLRTLAGRQNSLHVQRLGKKKHATEAGEQDDTERPEK